MYSLQVINDPMRNSSYAYHDKHEYVGVCCEPWKLYVLPNHPTPTPFFSSKILSFLALNFGNINAASTRTSQHNPQLLAMKLTKMGELLVVHGYLYLTQLARCYIWP